VHAAELYVNPKSSYNLHFNSHCKLLSLSCYSNTQSCHHLLSHISVVPGEDCIHQLP